MASAWVLEAVKADIAARIAVVAPFLPVNLAESGILGEVTRVYWDTGNVLRGAQIDKYVLKEVEVLQAFNKLPAEVVNEIPPHQRVFQPIKDSRGQKRPLSPSKLDCSSGKCARGAQRERPPPLRQGAVSPIFGDLLTSFECPLEDSCYIEDYAEKLASISVLSVPEVIDISDDSDRTLTDEEMLG